MAVKNKSHCVPCPLKVSICIYNSPFLGGRRGKTEGPPWEFSAGKKTDNDLKYLLQRTPHSLTRVFGGQMRFGYTDFNPG
jgi:hypothetical protein